MQNLDGESNKKLEAAMRLACFKTKSYLPQHGTATGAVINSSIPRCLNKRAPSRHYQANLPACRKHGWNLK